MMDWKPYTKNIGVGNSFLISALLIPHLNVWEYFIGVGLVIAGFLYLLKKEGKVVNLDDYEKAISGDLSHLEEVQSN